MPQKCFFPISDPQDFFQKLGSVTFVPLLCFNLLQNIRKSLWTLEKATDKQQTNQWTMDMGDYIRSLQVKQGPKRQKSFYNQNQNAVKFIEIFSSTKNIIAKKQGRVAKHWNI